MPKLRFGRRNRFWFTVRKLTLLRWYSDVLLRNSRSLSRALIVCFLGLKNELTKFGAHITHTLDPHANANANTNTNIAMHFIIAKHDSDFIRIIREKWITVWEKPTSTFSFRNYDLHSTYFEWKFHGVLESPQYKLLFHLKLCLVLIDVGDRWLFSLFRHMHENGFSAHHFHDI